MQIYNLVPFWYHYLVFVYIEDKEVILCMHLYTFSWIMQGNPRKSAIFVLKTQLR